MSAQVFVDTNVFVYARDASEPAKQPLAAAWVERLWRDQTGHTSMQVLSEYYVSVTRKLDPGLNTAEAWDDVSALLAWTPQPVDKALLQRSHEIERRFKLSWWDSMIVGAAQLQGCALLLSEDLQESAVFGDVTVRSPFKLAANEPLPVPWHAAPAERQHPPRGRPRRPSL